MKVALAMSGGVDSSVAALLLKKSNYTVCPFYMKNWQEEDDYMHCNSEADIAYAKEVSEILGLHLKVINFSREYWEKVFQIFLDKIRQNITPNPDVLCNKEIKFKLFLDFAKENGFEYIATGHYARKQLAQNSKDFCMLRGSDKSKDQTYFLHAISQDSLAMSIFPIGEMSKNQVREMAKDYSFKNFDKKSSTGICFIGNKNFRDFIKNYVSPNPGAIYNEYGDRLGEHEGLHCYTIGQRKGIGIGGVKKYADKPWYVIDKLAKENILVISQNINLTRKSSFFCKDLNWISGCMPNFSAFNSVSVKIRYGKSSFDNEYECFIEKTNVYIDCIIVKLKTPILGVVEGQSAVFYNDDVCLGGGEIFI